jgi:hypothetical protein
MDMFGNLDTRWSMKMPLVARQIHRMCPGVTGKYAPSFLAIRNK